MSRHRFGQGNGPTRKKTLARNRRMSEAVRGEDERDIGNRPGVARRVPGIDEESDMYWDADGFPISKEEYERRKRNDAA